MTSHTVGGHVVEVLPLSAEDGGGFSATVADLPGCMRDGETPEEALANVAEAIEAWKRPGAQAWFVKSEDDVMRLAEPVEVFPLEIHVRDGALLIRVRDDGTVIFGPGFTAEEGYKDVWRRLAEAFPQVIEEEVRRRQAVGAKEATS